MTRYRIKKRKHQDSNLTTYTLQKYVIRFPNTPQLGMLGVWINFATTQNHERMKQWKVQYNAKI